MKFLYLEDSLKSGIYKIVNTSTNRIYIGQAKEFKSRWRGHKSSLLLNKHKNNFLQNDFKNCLLSLGHDDFLEFHVLEVMENSSKEERNKREEFWISISWDKQDRCYNFRQLSESKPASFQPARSAEVRQRMSEAHKRAMTPERKELLSQQRERLWQNDEHRQMMSEASRQRWQDSKFKERVGTKIAEANRGSKRSEETRRKMALAKQGCKLSEETRKRMSLAAKKRWSKRNVQTDTIPSQ